METKTAEDEQRLKEYREDEAACEARDEYYHDWLSDNIDELREEFIDNHFEDQFDGYCRTQFKEYLENR